MPMQIKSVFGINVPLIKKIFLFIPAVAGYFLNAPLYIPIQKFAFKKFSKIDHYDSVVAGLLLLLYPIYLIVIVFGTSFFFGYWALVTFILLPFFAWSYVQLK